MSKATEASTASGAASTALTGYRYRLAVGARVLAALAGGYLLTPAIQALLQLALPFSQAPPFPQNDQAASLLGYAIQLGIVIWCSHVRSLVAAWLWPLGWTLVCYALAAVLLWLGWR